MLLRVYSNYVRNLRNYSGKVVPRVFPSCWKVLAFDQIQFDAYCAAVWRRFEATFKLRPSNSQHDSTPSNLHARQLSSWLYPNTKSLNESTPSNLHPRQISSWPYLKQLAPKATLIMTGTVNPKSLNESKLHPRQLSSWQHPKQL